jgi:hypothetical protein
MGVKHRVDLGPRAIDLGVNRKLQRRLDVSAIDRAAVEIDRDDVFDRPACGSRRRAPA